MQDHQWTEKVLEMGYEIIWIKVKDKHDAVSAETFRGDEVKLTVYRDRDRLYGLGTLEDDILNLIECAEEHDNPRGRKRLFVLYSEEDPELRGACIDFEKIKD